MHQPESFADRVGAVAALDEPVRRALFELVMRSADPVSRDTAAEVLSLPRSTAAFHLDRLAAEGLVEVAFRRLSGRTGPGAGRPSKLYRRPEGEISVSLPERHYDFAAALLAAAVEEASDSGQPVGSVLPRLARTEGSRLAEPGEDVVQVLDRHGFEPRADGSGGFVLANCPFHKLAQRFTALVCGVNVELLRGVAEATHTQEYDVVLDPAPGRCCVRLASRSSTG